jgi:hypothetical protein
MKAPQCHVTHTLPVLLRLVWVQLAVLSSVPLQIICGNFSHNIKYAEYHQYILQNKTKRLYFLHWKMFYLTLQSISNFNEEKIKTANISI